MTQRAEAFITFLTGIAIFMFVVFNAQAVTSLGNGLAGTAVTYVSGLATVGRGA